MYRLRKYKGGHYVATDGRKNAYTTDIHHARKFETREEAEKNRCVESEYIENGV